MQRLGRSFLVLSFLFLLQMGVNIIKSTQKHAGEYQAPKNKKFSQDLISKLEVTHIAFLKVHKTASTTVQNIFLRYGQSRNLTFILSHDKADLAEIDYLPNVISVKESLNDKNIVPPPSGKHFDILCCHVIYNHENFVKYLPRDTFYIGLVREPTERLESAFAFFGHLRSTNLSDYAQNPYSYHHFVGSMTNNRMAFAFGFDSSLFPKNGSSTFTEENKRKVDVYLAKIRSEFNLILIYEKMNHSIVLMKRMLHWHVKDVVFISQFSHSKKKGTFLKGEKDNIRSYLYLDYLLYDFALSEFNRKVDTMNDDFLEEVQHFTQIIEQISNFCHDDTMTSMHIPLSKWDSCFNVTKMDCCQYIKREIPFIREIRKRQYGQLNI